MEHWLPALPSFVAIVALWWKVTTNMATKQDIQNLRSELQADIRATESRLQSDIRELRQMFIGHIGDHSHVEVKQSNPG